MTGLAGSLVTLFAGAFLCLAAIGRPRLTRVLGPAVTVAGGLLGLMSVAAALGGRTPATLRLPWSMPFGCIVLGMDALSAVFAGAILVIAALAAVFGAGYLRPLEGKRDLAQTWFLLNLLTGSMLLVVVAGNAMLFLLAWEVMSLTSFLLVMFESGQDSVRRAGWTYLVATHIGTAFLLVLFVLLGRNGGTLDFSGFSLSGASPALAGTAFVLAVVGFGTKAGFMPLHVWLPEAHPAAPSHVSAVMSGVMIKTGIYGLLRVLPMLGTPPPWWGWTLLAIGAVSGILGVLFALAQHDLKRLLAYHSVENIGIIALGMGLGLLGTHYGHPAMVLLGYAGALLHVVNHAVFKSLLFMGAGSVLHATATREIEHLGGLLKRMPATGLAFLVGSVAICGLPPLNGFVSEFLIAFGALCSLTGAPSLPASGLGAGLVVLASLALIGGFAAACFAKAFGVVFLGEPRTEHAAHAHESGPAMRIPMAVLAAACLVIGFSGPAALALLKPAVAVVAGGGFAAAPEAMGAGAALRTAAAAAAGLLVLAALLALARRGLMAGRDTAETVTWDCGYAAPTARMQYTASSFAEPLTRLFRALLRTHRRFDPPAGLFPVRSSFATETPDVYRERMYGPMFSSVENVLARFRWLQHGRVNLYVLNIVLVLLALLAWKLR